MKELIWTDGEKFIKTKKEDKPILNNKDEIVKNIPLRGKTTRNRDKLQQDKIESFVKERPMLVQTYLNPFLTKDFNQVIDDQEKFLIPKDSLGEPRS